MSDSDSSGDGCAEAPQEAPAAPAAPSLGHLDTTASAPAKERFKEEDKPKLAKRVMPTIVPTIESMAEQIKKAKQPNTKGLFARDQEVVAEPMEQAAGFVITQVDHLAKVIETEREAIVAERKDADRQRLKKKEIKEKVNTIAYLSTRTDKMMAQYELSSRYHGARHFLIHFLPLQFLVTAAAIISFIAASDVKKRPSVAVVLSLIAGIIGFIVTFITTMERHCNWKSKADVDKATAIVYSKMTQDIESAIARITSGEPVDAREMVRKIEEKMKNIEDLSGEHLIPTDIRMAFHHLELQIKLAVSDHNKKEADKARQTTSGPGIPEHKEREYSRLAFAKAVEYITSYRYCCILGWPFGLPKAEIVADKVSEQVLPKSVLATKEEKARHAQMIKEYPGLLNKNGYLEYKLRLADERIQSLIEALEEKEAERVDREAAAPPTDVAPAPPEDLA